MTNVKRRPRVLFYSDSPTVGGHELTALEVVNALARTQEFDVTFLCHDAGLRESVTREVATGPTLVASARPLPGFRNLRPIVTHATRQIIARHSPDLVVAVQGNIEMGLVGLLAARSMGIRTVSYLPLGYTFGEIGARLARIRDTFDRALYRIPQAFITYADHQAKLIGRFSSAPKFVLRALLPKVAGEYAIQIPPADRPLRVGIIGRIYFRHKNQRLIAQAAAIARDRGLPIVFDVIGDGPNRADLEREIADFGVEDRVKLHGWLAREAVQRFTADSLDVVVAPSFLEGGLPIALLEALQLGKPILMARIAGVEEYQLPERSLVSPHEPGELVERLNELRNNGLPPGFDAARRFILNRQSKRNFDSTLRTIFETLTARAL